MLVSIHYCCVSIKSFKPPQKKKTQQDDVIKRAPVKAQMMENHVQVVQKLFCDISTFSWISRF